MMLYKKLLLMGFALLPVYSSYVYASEEIAYSIDGNRNYSTGKFEHFDDDGEIYASPFRAASAPLQSCGIYNGQPKELPFESMLYKRKPSQDGRQRITNVTEWPHLLNAQLEMTFSQGLIGGSGTLVGPHHVLTVAHNVYQNKEWATDVKVRPALNDEVAPFNSIPVTRIYTFKGWIDKQSPVDDMALLILRDSIGLKTGWAGLLAARDEELLSQYAKVTITGYPGDKGFKQMWGMTHVIARVNSEQLFYQIDTYGGQSGSGISINVRRTPFVIGVHNLGATWQDLHNSGVRLSPKKITSLLKWISETCHIDERIPGPVPSSRLSTSSSKAIQDNLSAADCYQRGLNYTNGRGVQQDAAKAVKWYRKAAEQGNAWGQNNLGLMYENGRGIGKDEQQAVVWYRKAAEQGYANAQYNLGLMYKDGRGTAKDDQQAVVWYRKAAEQGHAWGQNNLGWMYKDGRGVQQSDAEAVKWYRKAADQGHADAQANLGWMYENGRGIGKDEQQAVIWFRKAAEQGYANAQYNLGVMYKNGRGVLKNDTEAVKWYRKAADQGYANAQWRLGMMYKDGQGTVKDDQQAVIWFRKAADQGHADAQANLGWMYENGRGVLKDDAEVTK